MAERTLSENLAAEAAFALTCLIMPLFLVPNRLAAIGRCRLIVGGPPLRVTILKEGARDV